ncbi:MAG: hypothetical protein CMF49_03785 [Legionellales bacterium]|nr:hypothetical protein [Legionellales bacterium]|tara:strand:- start:1945 stop:2262 length:318 start_codon:yes stop_codon:yes gene_type:complete
MIKLRKLLCYKKVEQLIAMLSVFMLSPIAAFASSDMMSESMRNGLDYFNDDIAPYLIAITAIGLIIAFKMGRLDKAALVKWVICSGALVSVPFILSEFFSLNVSM